MTSFFRKNLTPASNKNFFQNYGDHIKYLVAETEDVVDQFSKIKTTEQFVRFVDNKVLNRLNIFECLRDGHDYMDEVGGVTVVPVVMTIVAIATLTVAVLEGMHELAIQVGLAKTDKYDDHGENAARALCAAVLAFGFAMASYLKSAISLVTRPGVTVVQGFAPQNKERFYNDDSIVSEIGSAFSDFSF